MQVASIVIAPVFLYCLVTSVVLVSCAGLAGEASEEEKALAALIPHIDAGVKAGTVRAWLKVGNNQKQSVVVLGADGKHLRIRVNNDELPMAWKFISSDVIAETARAATRNSVAGALALASYCIATGQRSGATAALDVAAGMDKDKKFSTEIEALGKKISASEPAESGRKIGQNTTSKDSIAAAESGDWPQFGYDAGCRFATPGSLKFPMSVKWRYNRAAPAALVASTVIAKTRVVLSCIGDKNGNAKIGDPANNPYLIGLDFNTGGLVWEWSHKHDWAIGCYLAVAGRSVVFNDDGFGAVDWETGKKAWGGGADDWGSTNVDQRADLIVHSCTMKVDNPGPGIYATDLGGRRKWSALQEAGEKCKDGMPFCSLCQGSGLVFVSARWAGAAMKRSRGLFALKQTDGCDVWKLDGEWGGVSFDGRYVYSVKTDDGKLYCLDPVKGSTIWSMSVGGEARHPPAHGRGTCIVLTDSGVLFAFNTNEKPGSISWQNKTEKPFTARSLRLSGVRMSGNAQVVDDLAHAYRRANLAIAEASGKGGVLVVANGSTVCALDLRTGVQLWCVPWDEKGRGPVANPAIANGCLIVNSHDEVVCFESRP